MAPDYLQTQRVLSGHKTIPLSKSFGLILRHFVMETKRPSAPSHHPSSISSEEEGAVSFSQEGMVASPFPPSSRMSSVAASPLETMPLDRKFYGIESLDEYAILRKIGEGTFG